MACGWCGSSQGGDEESHGICDGCMESVFGVNPAEIHAEISSEQIVVVQDEKKN